MFGTITIPAEMPYGITAREFEVDVDTASQMMQISADNRRSARTAEALGYDELAAYHLCLAQDWSRLASRQMHAFRSAVTVRTAIELEWARVVVESGHARFQIGACSDETCDDCDRPMWHHILVADTMRLCPFGRRYWTIARAIHDDHEELGGYPARDLLADIARR